MDHLDNALTRFYDWIDERGVIRRIVLGIAIWMTWEVSQWAMAFVACSQRPGIDLAAIIAAVTGPVTLFGGYVFKAYIDSRSG
jgi:hypothetical protein